MCRGNWKERGTTVSSSNLDHGGDDDDDDDDGNNGDDGDDDGEDVEGQAGPLGVACPFLASPVKFFVCCLN